MSDPAAPAALVPRVVELCRASAAELEFSTFLVGVRARRLSRELSSDRFQAWKTELRREAGRILAEDWQALGRRPEFVRPELLLVYDADRGCVEPSLRPVLLYGRYRKLCRDLPQTRAHWKHPPCRGQGCPGCEGTGRLHPLALEDLLGVPCAPAFQASGWRLHGMGREDVDVRCLGQGRPFVLELESPRRRSADLAALSAEVDRQGAGRVELARPLEPAGEHVIPRLKASEARKAYRALVRAGGPLPAQLDGLEAALGGARLAQRTPERVSRRRADLVRARTVHRCRVLARGGDWVELELLTDSGTYVKELISGDQGRTTPSVAGVLGVACVCVELDVLGVEAEDAQLLAPCELTGPGDRVESAAYDAG